MFNKFKSNGNGNAVFLLSSSLNCVFLLFLPPPPFFLLCIWDGMRTVGKFHCVVHICMCSPVYSLFTTTRPQPPKCWDYEHMSAYLVDNTDFKQY